MYCEEVGQKIILIKKLYKSLSQWLLFIKYKKGHIKC